MSQFINQEIYFVDSQLSDVGSLLAALPTKAEVHVLDTAADGLDQMLAVLCERTGLDAIHLLSHAEPGRLALGAGWLTLETLEARADDLARLGQTLAVGGDLLLYGCELAKGAAGQAFVARVAQLTGADVAASLTLTGDAASGGDWDLAVRHGRIDTLPLAAHAYPGVLAPSAIAGLTAIAVTEGDAAVAIDQGIIFNWDSGYAGGSITFAVSDPTAGDQLRLTNGADGDQAGAITLDAGVVYLGNGAGRDAIATVDATENGENGAALTIHFTAQNTAAVTNPSFEDTPAFTGWTVGEDRVILGSTVINGFVTPVDPTYPALANGDADSASFSFNSELSSENTDGDVSLRLYNSGSTVSYGVVHGPYAYSNTFAAAAGDTFHFDWQAAAGGDAYDAFGYLMSEDGSQTLIVINETGDSDSGMKAWSTGSVTVPTDGNWFFVFVSGTYDFSGGTAAGGSLFVDNFRVERSPVNEAIIKTITSQVTYQNTADNPPAGARDLTVTLIDGAGVENQADTTLTVAGVNDAPTGHLEISGQALEGGTLTAVSTLDDPDGMGTISYQWQVGGVDINGATGSTLVVTGDYVEKLITVVASFTDQGGQLETVTSGGALIQPPPPPPTTEIVDGAPVQIETGVSPEGTPVRTLTIPIVQPTRTDSVGEGAAADIPLFTTPGGPTLLTAQLPVGFGLQVGGATTPGTAGTSLTDLIREIRAHTLVGSADQNVLTGGGSGFLADLPESTPMLVQTIVPQFATGSGVPTAPLVISGTPAAAGQPMTALVIDARGLPAGAPLQLQNVEFAAVIGAVNITGGEGRQIVWGDSASQYMVLGEDDDILRGGAGADTVGSAGGNDQLFGDEGDDVVFGGEGDDILHGNAGSDTVNGDAGDDIVHGGKGDDRLFGDAGNDVILGDLDNDFIHGNAGADTLNGGEGSDSVYGGQDNDVVFGDSGDDLLFGDKGDDFLQGNAGADTLVGGEGSDLIHGGKDNDYLSGGAGADTLSGDLGDDILVGGSGADVFMTFAGGGADRVLDFNFAEGDRVHVEAGSAYTLAQVGADTVITMTAGSLTLENVQLSSLGDGWIIGG